MGGGFTITDSEIKEISNGSNIRMYLKIKKK